MVQSNIWLAFPSLILGAFCLVGSFLVLFLPETLNRTIPSTLADGEAFGRGEHIFDFSCFEGRRRRAAKKHISASRSSPTNGMGDSSTTILSTA